MCNATSGVGLINNVSLHNANFQTKEIHESAMQIMQHTTESARSQTLLKNLLLFLSFFLLLEINCLEYTLPKNNRKRLLIPKIIVLNAKTLPCLLDSRNRVRSSETTDKDILGAERKEHAEHSQGKNMNN